MRRSRAPSRAGLSPRTGGTGSSSDADSIKKTPPVSQETKRVNTAAIRQGDVSVVRAPLLGCLTVPKGPGLVAGAFKLPGGARRTGEGANLLKRKSLGVRRPVTFMTLSKFRPPTGSPEPPSGDFELLEGEEEGEEDAGAATVVEEEQTWEPLVLWEAGPMEDDNRISVDPRLCKWLRPHQREGVQFMFECVMGMRETEGHGCILADDMGLGKTLQSIAVLWTLLKQGKERGQPAVKRAIVVCPTSLVKNWEAEIDKWLKGDCRVIALSETTRDQVVQSINLFLASMIYKVLVVSYETFRLHSKRFYAKADTCCDLLICDEAHRLKNAETATNQALSALKCRRRVLLSGTPMQNDLEEFYAMADFTNPGVLGNASSFRKKFLAPILAGREPSASDKQVERAQKCQNEMSTVVNEFILRRTNNINAKHLPPKLVQVVCCRLTPLQMKIYKHLLSSKEIRHILNGKQTNILSSIGAMQKLCNHPKLLVEGGASRNQDSGLAEVASFLPSTPAGGGAAGGGSMFGGGRRGGGGVQKGVFPEWSGKMETLFRLMKEMRRTGDDRIVVVSNYTSSLDLIGSMCRENSWPFVRLDGSTGVSKRQKMVDAFNLPGPRSFAFLLSSKAGGCGLNLIGGNRLVLFDPDWNPAVDKQAAARVWRDGQKKRCFVYRFVSTGTIEEKVFQRQLSKEGLQNIVDDKEEVNSLSSKDLKDLFKLYEGTPSDTHDKLRCKRCRIEEAVQAVKDVDAKAFRQALPKQLGLCGELLTELADLPGGNLFQQQWDAEEDGAPPEAFTNNVHEPMDFGKIAAKLRASAATTSTLALTEETEVSGGSSCPRATDGERAASAAADGVGLDQLAAANGENGCRLVGECGGGGGVEASSSATGFDPPASAAQAAVMTPYASVPAFARDMNLVFANVRRVWPMGAVGGDNRLTQAADSLKMAFDSRWRALAPHLHSIQREALEEARAEAAQASALAREQQGEDSAGDLVARFQEQMGMPKEEDLNSWSHHYSTDTADDSVFRGAMLGTGDSLVSFVFGLEVTWDLLSIQLEEEAEARAIEIKAKTEARAARAADKLAKAAEAEKAAAAAKACETIMTEGPGEDGEGLLTPPTGRYDGDYGDSSGGSGGSGSGSGSGSGRGVPPVVVKMGSGSKAEVKEARRRKKQRKKKRRAIDYDDDDDDDEGRGHGRREGGNGRNGFEVDRVHGAADVDVAVELGEKRRRRVVDREEVEDDGGRVEVDGVSNAAEGMDNGQAQDDAQCALRAAAVAALASLSRGQPQPIGGGDRTHGGKENIRQEELESALNMSRAATTANAADAKRLDTPESYMEKSPGAWATSGTVLAPRGQGGIGNSYGQEGAWTHQGSEQANSAGHANIDGRSAGEIRGGRRENFGDAKDGVDIEDDETSAGEGTQVEDALPGTLEDPLEGTALESEDEVMETPLSGSVHEESQQEHHHQQDHTATEDDEYHNSGRSQQYETADGGGGGDVANDTDRLAYMSNNGNMDSLRAKPNAVALHEWQCKKCTYANAISRIKCVMCMEGKRPPGVGRTQPLSPRPPGEENREWFEEQDSSVTKKKEKRSKKGSGKEKTSSKKPKEKRRKREVWIDEDEDYSA